MQLTYQGKNPLTWRTICRIVPLVLFGAILFAISSSATVSAQTNNATITGTVTDSSGNPIENMQVRWTSYNGNTGTICTDANGEYSMTQVETGVNLDIEVSYPTDSGFPWSICSGTPAQRYATEYASGGYYQNWNNQIVLSDFQLYTHDFQLELSAVITGTVTDVNMNPLINATVQAVIFVDNQTQESGFTSTDSNGEYIIYASPVSGLYIQAKPYYDENYVAEYYNDAVLVSNAISLDGSASSSFSNINFVLSPGATISGTITDIQGNPLANASVYAQLPGDNNSYAVTTSDTSGDYTLSGLPTDIGLYVSANLFPFMGTGYSYSTRYYPGVTQREDATLLTIQHGQSALTDIDIALTRAVSISGVVTDANTGQPIPNAQVIAYNADLTVNIGGCADNAGAYSIPSLPEGETVTVYAGTTYCGNTAMDDYALQYYDNTPIIANATPITLGSTDVTGVDFALEPVEGAIIQGTVIDATTDLPIEGMWVYVSEYNYTGAWQGVGACTDANGEYSISGIPVNQQTTVYVGSACQGFTFSYQQEYYNNTNNWADRDAVTALDPITITGIDFMLDPAATVAGTITDADTGLPIANVPVRARGTDGGYNPGYFDCTDSNGVFVWTSVIPGDQFVIQANPANSWCGDGTGVQNYVNEFYSTSSDPVYLPSQASVLTAPAAFETLMITMDLEQGGSFSGTVLSEGSPVNSGSAIAFIVDEQFNRIESVGGAATTNDGTYTIIGIPFGYDIYVQSYKSIWDEQNRTSIQTLAYEWYSESNIRSDATSFQLTPGASTRSGVDFTLVPIGTITGTVYDADGTPLANVPVGVGDNDFGACTDEHGHFTILYSGEGELYDVWAGGDAWCDDTSQPKEWYDNALSADEATQVAGGSTGIDFVLDGSALNDPPIVTNPGDQTNIEQEQVSLQIIASDDATQTLTYAASNLPDGLTINTSTGLISGTISTTASESSPYAVSITVSDDFNTPAETIITFSWTVTREILLQAPIDTITDGYGNPLFRWTDVGATQYELYVMRTDGSRPAINPTIDADGICNDTICETDLTTLDTAYRLYNGAHTWYVREAGGTWSDGEPFTLQAEPPALVTTGTPEDVDTYTPTFNWTLSGNALYAADFTLYLAGSDGSAPLYQRFTRTETCGSDDGINCTLESPVALADGIAYTLYIQSHGPGGNSTGGVFGGYAEFAPFTINVPKPVLSTPGADAVLTDNLLYGYGDFDLTWTGVEGATGYELFISRNGIQFFYNLVTMTCTTCSLDLTTISEDYRMTDGAYSWYIRAQYADTTWSPWVGARNFTLDVDPPALVAPLSATATNTYTPTFNWSLGGTAANATYFNLYLSGDNNTSPISGWYTRAEVCGTVDATSCAFESPVALADGVEYTLYIQSYGPGGNSTGGVFGGYAEFAPFTVNVPKPVLVAPGANAVLTDSTLHGHGDFAFAWTGVENALGYELYATFNGAMFFYDAVPCASNTNCNVDLTTISEDYRMYNGAYTWYMRAQYADASWSPWAGPMNFTLAVDPPALVSPLPATNINTYTPTFNWSLSNTATNATYFNLYLTGSDGTTPVNGWYSRTATCGSVDAVSCAFTSPVALADGVTYTLFIQSYGAGGISTGGEFDNGYMAFTPFTINVPKPAPGLPNTTVTSGFGDPDFTWTGITGATGYEIYVARNGLQFFYQTVTCTTEPTCSVNLASISENFRLTNGEYTWYMRAQYADTSWSPWAGPVNFTVSVPPASLVTPANPTNPTMLRPTFNWTLAGSAATDTMYFQLVIGASDGTTLLDTTTWTIRSELCGTMNGTNCAFTPDFDLTPGLEYTLYVQSYSIGGISTGGAFGNGYVAVGMVTPDTPLP